MPYHPPKSMIQVLRDLRLTTGLQVCLDAGDSASYTSGQSWLDTSGNGYDFFLGQTVASEASDPTFNGVAGGLSSSEYFSFDGGDYFRYDTTNEAWMNRLHQDNVKFSIATWFYNGTAGVNSGIFGTKAAPSSNTGATLFVNTGGALVFRVENAAANVLAYTSAISPPVSEWVYIGLSVNEGNSSGGVSLINGASEIFDATYSSPSSGNATFTLEIGARGGGNAPLTNLSRLGTVAIWEGVALSAAQLLSIYQYPYTAITGHTSIRRPTRVMEY